MLKEEKMEKEKKWRFQIEFLKVLVLFIQIDTYTFSRSMRKEKFHLPKARV